MDRKKRRNGYLIRSNIEAKIRKAFFEDGLIIIWFNWPNLCFLRTNIRVYKNDYMKKSKNNPDKNNLSIGISNTDRDKADNASIDIPDIDKIDNPDISTLDTNKLDNLNIGTSNTNRVDDSSIHILDKDGVNNPIIYISEVDWVKNLNTRIPDVDINKKADDSSTSR